MAQRLHINHTNMNRIITDDVDATKYQPLVADSGTGSIPFLQDGVQEAIWNILLGSIGSYTANDLIISNGVVISITGGGNTVTWTKGAIGYNGEIYAVDAGTATKTGGQTFVFQTVNTFDSGLDPIVFTDNSGGHYVHQVRKITILAGTSGSGIADYNSSAVKRLVSKKIIPIGHWNMDATANLGISHGLSALQFQTIKNIQAIIIIDTQDAWYKIDCYDGLTNDGTMAGGIGACNTSNLALLRKPSGLFDSSLFVNNTTLNRGFVSIEFGDI